MASKTSQNKNAWGNASTTTARDRRRLQDNNDTDDNNIDDRPSGVVVYEYTGNGQQVPEDVVCVRFHPSVVEVDDAAFYKRSNLREVVFNEGLVKIGNFAFDECTSLESITIPSSVKEICKLAFFKCHSLKEVVLNEGLKKIGMQAFERCKPLQSITLPSSLVEFGGGAFSECTSLREVVLNEGLERIGWRAFYNCPSLQSITIPSSVVEIWCWTFNHCKQLREVVCSGALPTIEYKPKFGDCFGGCSALERITFPNLSFRLDAIIRAGQVDVQNKIQQCINKGEIEWERGGTIYIPVEVTRNNDIWKELKQRVDQIINLIKYYEMKEATTIFELALWKATIDQVEDDGFRTRDECRVDVPGPVKDTIMQYL